MKVCVSGARGFVGRSLLRVLAGQQVETVGLVRDNAQEPGEIAIGDLAADRPIGPLPKAEAFVHLAARVHVMADGAADRLAAYRQANVHGTRSLLEAARQAGIERFVFVSTIKVLGEETLPGAPFTQDSVPNPSDPYAISKHEAEQEVTEFCERHAMTWSIVRPVLVFGPGVSANFAQLMRLVARGIPLPFASIRNARSLLFVDNLSAFLAEATHHRLLANRIVNLADPPPLSTGSLVRSIARAMDRRPALVPFPPAAIELAGSLIGRASAVHRLTRSLEVDTDRLFEELQWRPGLAWDDALRQTTADVLRHSRAAEALSNPGTSR